MVTPPTAAVAVPPLEARLHTFSVSLNEGGQQDGGGFAECWGAMVELQSCTSEIVLFFMNGESYIGPECCVTICGATRHCWPSMLASIGFTEEEADVLHGFCDAEPADGPPPPSPSGPVQAPGLQ
ncbi:hypothetical protein BAE44_0003211 [Dichanthelium oligosanthes]|uniref:Prolamin-like domain-containing protein n=1 Tax=Dichanthelium oligosanthes TaxID=888268 RepID=A0A1E5WF02_9POAL|nr:hypothetical protein BAE44_0003211 [Dichanthelium oligosanthes]